MQIEGKKMKVYFSYAICSDYLCMFLVTICIFHRFVNERPETRCEKKLQLCVDTSFFIVRIKILSRGNPTTMV